MQNNNLQTSLTPKELEELGEIFAARDLSVSYLHGYFCAIISAPTFLMPSTWQQPLYDELEFESDKQVLKTAGLVFRFYNEVISQLRNNQFTPLLYKGANIQLDNLEIAEDWSQGYLNGIDIDPMWSKLRDEDMEMELLLLPFACVAGYICPKEETAVSANVANVKEYKQMLFSKFEEIIKFFYQTWTEARQTNYEIKPRGMPYMNKEQGRNELCACGSGKKYKKCCLNTRVFH